MMRLHVTFSKIAATLGLVIFLAPQQAWAQASINDQCFQEANQGSRAAFKTLPNEVSAPKSVKLTFDEIKKKYGGQCTCRASFYLSNRGPNELVIVPDGQPALIEPVDATTYTSLATTRISSSVAHMMMFCTEDAKNQMYTDSEIVKTANTLSGTPEPPASKVGQYIVAGINGILWVIARILLWILEQLSKLVGYLLGYGTFITDKFVQAGWPFILGIANLGFVLALLFIAAATTLNISGFSARRMLPRLLISAVLINFSLILAGLMVDVTRIVMAAMASFLGSTNLQAIGLDILQKSQLLGTIVKVTTNGVELGSLGGDNTKWGQVVVAFQSVFLIGIITLGFAILALGLIVRHITLLLLLVISPLPYLAFALPGLSQYANGWWKKFIAQLLYGPAALLVLILIAIVGGVVEGGLLSIIFSAALLGAAAKFGKSAGTIGGAAVTDYFSGKARGAGKEALRLGKRGVGLAGRGAYEVTGAGRAVRRVGEEAGVLGRTLARPFRRDLASRQAYREERQRLREEQDQKSIKEAGRKATKEAYQAYQAPEKLARERGQAQDAAEAYAALSRLPAGGVANLGRSDQELDDLVLAGTLTNDQALAVQKARVSLAPELLRQGHVKDAIGNDAIIHGILPNTTSAAQVRAIIDDDDFMDGLSEEEQLEVIKIIRNNKQVQATEIKLPTQAELKGLTPQQGDAMIAEVRAAQVKDNQDARESLVESAVAKYRRKRESKKA